MLDDHSSSANASIRREKPPVPTAMVLLVDDQVLVVEAIRRCLANHPGIDFHYCTDSGKAVALANQLRPTVILQDLIMPGVDGMTLVRNFRANPATENTPIIVLSTKEDPVVKEEAFGAGANDYLVKLPDRLELVARIRYHTQAYLSPGAARRGLPRPAGQPAAAHGQQHGVAFAQPASWRRPRAPRARSSRT